jgi:hypothetical protein
MLADAKRPNCRGVRAADYLTFAAHSVRAGNPGADHRYAAVPAPRLATGRQSLLVMEDERWVLFDRWSRSRFWSS